MKVTITFDSDQARELIAAELSRRLLTSVSADDVVELQDENCIFTGLQVTLDLPDLSAVP